MFFKAPSKTHGLGVFTDTPIKKGEATFDMWMPPFLRPEEVTDDMRAMQIDDDLYSGESGAVEDYVNHSCMPNLAFTDGSAVLYALRDIDAGEEVTWDYSTAEDEVGWRIPCNCGASNCRGEVRSFCDLSDSDQEKLIGFTLNYIRRRYAQKFKPVAKTA